MNATDPLQLIKAVSSLLNINGGISGPAELETLLRTMKQTKDLVERCVYLNILRVTESNELLQNFIKNGGWSTMNSWISDAKQSDNMPLVLEIIKFLQRLPLKIEDLKLNNTPKLIKSFAKSASCPKVKSTSASLMNSWLAIIRDSSGSTTAVQSESIKKKKEKLRMNKAKSDKGVKKDQSKPKESKPPPVSRAPSFAKFRKTGLETEQEIPKKPGKRSSIDSEDSNIPDKKPKVTKKIAMSGGFMDALNFVPTAPLGKRAVKRKPTTAKPKTSSGSPVHKTSPVHDNFSGEAADFGVQLVPRAKSPSPIPVEVEPKRPKLNKYGKPQKSLSWAVDSLLESVRYFEVEEGERVNVSTQNFKDALQRERLLERETLGDFHHKGDSSWKKPPLIDLPAALVEIGCNSEEKEIQTEREKTVLQSIFLTMDMVPDTPAEPDPEPYDMIPPKIIPIDDPNDPGPPASSPADSIVKSAINGLVGKNGGDDITDKLREIIQNATGKKPEPHSPTESNAPHGDAVPPHPHMLPNGVDPNMMYMVPPGNGYFPQGPMMVPPGMMPGEQFPMDWNGPRMPPLHMQGPRPRGGQRPRFHPAFNRNENWRPRGPWRGHDRGRFNHPRASFRR